MANHQFSSEHQGHHHQNMAYPGGYMQPQWAPGYNASIHVPTLYDPATPSFQPNGMHMQPYNEPRTAPFPDMQQMQKYLVGMNVSHMNDKLRLERTTLANAKVIADLRDTVQRDLRALKSRLKALQDDDTEIDRATVVHEEIDDLSALIKKAKLSGDLSPTQEMLSRWNPELIAQQYLEEASDQEAAAVLMRAAAQEISGEVYQKNVTDRKLLEAPPVPGSKVSGFACCETAYSNVNELVAHVKEAHSEAVKPRSASNASSQHTPTHGPAPRPRSSRSPAIEVKAPVDKGHAETGRILGRLVEKNLAHAAPQDSPTVLPVQPHQTTKWVPFAVRQMREQSADIPEDTVTFSWAFLRDCLHGEEWSSGFYFNRNAGEEVVVERKKRSKKEVKQEVKREGTAYWLLDPEHEPYLPEAPGKHGAKLTAFFNDSFTEPGHGPQVRHYMDCPVFIKQKDSNEYRYYGHYSQTRYSDKVDYDHLMTQIPQHVRRYWAAQLGSKGRPQWVTEKLIEQFWPRPTYDGPTPTDSACQTPATFATGEDSAGGIEKHVMRALDDYSKQLKDWKKDALLKVAFLAEDSILESFTKPDSDAEPGMRLWWEYFEFQSFDHAFYENMARLSKDPSIAKAAGKGGAKRPATPPIRGTGEPDMKAGALDEKEERKLGAFMPARPAPPPVRGTRETALKADTIDNNAVQIVKASPKTGDDVAAAVATLHRAGMQKQTAIESKPQKSAIDQKHRDAWTPAPDQALDDASKKPASHASAVPESDLSGLNIWLLNDDKKAEATKPNAAKPEAAQPEVKKSNEANKALPNWGGGGDLTMAKRLNEEMTKALPGKGRRGPPHLRGK